MRVLAETARSRLTGEFLVKEPRLVRRSVSGETPTVKVPEDGEKEVMVRQVPFMLMLSPRWASVRISLAEEMVREVPPVSSWGLSSETAGDC
jgi:hypothetical protein